ncbi:MAG: hypothetical protein K8R48_03160 [Alphaproteobacteria bacterium]|nr:hypothetical protein [Alphaproteobacteria bacterium]
MSKQPNPKEAALIAEMQKALEKHMKPDEREGGHYFEGGTEAVFQDLARKTAALIEEQGVKGTCKTLLSVAREMKGLEEIEWNHANSIGFAFKKALGAEATSPAKSNPFAKKNFPKL